MKFSFEVAGVEQFSRAFNRIEEELDDLRTIWPEVAKQFYQIEGEQFRSEGGIGASGKWAALSPAYAKYKAVKFPNQPIGKATTSLFDAMTNPEAPGAIFKPERGQLTIGTSIPYGRDFHKKRSVISMNEDQKRRIQKAIQVGLVAFVRKQGFQVVGN
jgi:hypothetical protein